MSAWNKSKSLTEMQKDLQVNLNITGSTEIFVTHSDADYYLTDVCKTVE
jgi:hypothetical protein